MTVTLFGEVSKKCSGCNLSQNTIINPCIKPSKYGKKVEILFIGEAPGEQEDEDNKVFVGKTGQLLKKNLKKLRFTNFALTNAVRCRPITSNDRNRKPTGGEIKACNKFLLKEIRKYKDTLKIIVPLGNTALNSLMKLTGITRFRGKLLKYSNSKAGVENINVLPTFHPASMLYKDAEDKIELFVLDLKKVKDILRGNTELKKETESFNYKFAENDSQALSYLMQLQKHKIISVDIETFNKDDNRITVIGFGYGKKKAFCIPIWHNDIKLKHPDTVRGEIKSVLEDTSITKVLQNAKFDVLQLMRDWDIETKGKMFDTLLAHQLLDQKGSNDLETMVWENLPEYGGYKKRFWGRFDKYNNTYKIPIKDLSDYNCMDCDTTYQLAFILTKQLKKTGLWDLFWNIVMPVYSECYMYLMYYGVKPDIQYVKKIKKMLEAKIRNMRFSLCEYKEVRRYQMTKGSKFKLTSSDQLAEILFNRMKLPVISRTKKTKKPQVNNQVLIVLRDDHKSKFAKDLLDYKKEITRLNTFVTPILDKWTWEDGRIHPMYRFVDTGRTATKHPNMQNIERGSFLRNIYCSREGWWLLGVDYSQIELRVCAAISGDKAMTENYVNGGDIHITTGCGIFNCTPEELTKDQRTKAKPYNFGVIYMRSAEGLVSDRKDFNVDGTKKVKQVRKDIEAFLELYCSVPEYWDKVFFSVSKKGYITNPFGRRYYFRDLQGLTREEIRKEERLESLLRAAVNAPIQGGASDIIKKAFINIMRRLRKEKLLGMLNKVVPVNENHDALYWEIIKGVVREIAGIIKEEMENVEVPWLGDIPLVADLEIGKRWGTMKELEL